MHKKCLNNVAQIKSGMNIIVIVGKKEFSRETGFNRMSI